MTWSYRIVKRQGQEGPEAYAIYEVYYNEQGEIEAMTASPAFPAGETPEELRRDLLNMLADCDLPVLEEGKIEFKSGIRNTDKRDDWQDFSDWSFGEKRN